MMELKQATTLREELKKKVTDRDFLTTPINLVNVLPLLKEFVLTLEDLEMRLKKLEDK